jgi:membrane-bound serine protease (ClpP class)
VFALSLSAAGATAQAAGLAYSVELAREIDPAAARDLQQAIDDARRRRAKVVIVRLDTPGGAVVSTRQMVAAIAAAPMPVIVYVSPSGAHAGSAGAYLTLAADVAAMAPETNIGSATPVRLGPPARSESEERLLEDLRRKAINDSVAFARTLAESHGHNAALAERMVREAANVSAAKALQARLIDIIAPDERALLRALDGFSIKGAKAQRLRTQGLAIKHFDAPGALSNDDVEHFDNFSTLRFVAYIAAIPIIIALSLVGYGRGRPALRRRKARRHRERLKRRRAAEATRHERS